MSAQFGQSKLDTVVGTGLAVVVFYDAFPPPTQFDFHGLEYGFAPKLQRDNGL
jgi:hypothetical protein